MEHKYGEFKGYDGISLYQQRWLPAEPPLAVLLVVNGLAEHSGRYADFARFFVESGYAVYSYDHRGHGQSEGLRCHVERFTEFLDDLQIFSDLVRRDFPDTPLFLTGHSMGGTIAVAHALTCQSRYQGLILSGVVLRAGSSTPWLLATVAGLLSALVPKMGAAVLDASAISRDTSVVDAYNNDPLVYHGRIRARLGAELLKAAQNISVASSVIQIPALIMHGGSDRLSDPEGSRRFFDRISSVDKTLKIYEGFYHEIFNEPEQRLVFTEIENWLGKHLKGGISSA